MPSPRPSGSSSSAGRSSWRAVASGSRRRSRGCASASSRAPSGPTPRQIRSSSGSRASGSGSSPRPPRRRSSSATATPSSSRRSRSSRPRSTPSTSRSGTWRAPRSARCRSRSAGARRARRGVGEVQEPFGRGQKGSPAMPHKRNPVGAERICGLARVVRGCSLVALENVALWHERDISHSSAERVVIPDAFLALDYMLDRFAWLVEGLVVRPERMRRNLEASHFLFFSQRVLNALVESGLARDDGYRLVQRAAMRAWEEELDFRELCRADEEIASRVDLDSTFDIGAYTRHVDTVFARLEALKEEPLHA